MAAIEIVEARRSDTTGKINAGANLPEPELEPMEKKKTQVLFYYSVLLVIKVYY